MAPKEINRLDEQFSALPVSMLESPAWRALSLSARRFLDRLCIELAHHGGNDIDQLVVTYDQLVEEYGMDRHSIAPAIRETVALGFAEIMHHGRGGNAEDRSPTRYRLTFLMSRSGRAPTHEWRKIKTIAEAQAIAAAARGDKQPQFKRRKKQNAGGGKSPISVGVIHTESRKSPVGVSPTTAGEKPPLLSRFSGKGDNSITELAAVRRAGIANMAGIRAGVTVLAGIRRRPALVIDNPRQRSV